MVLRVFLLLEEHLLFIHIFEYWSADCWVNSDIAVGLQQGSYYVTTRDDLGCEVIDSIYISHPDPLTMESVELDWIDCYGYDNGLAYSHASGGTYSLYF